MVPLLTPLELLVSAMQGARPTVNLQPFKTLPLEIRPKWVTSLVKAFQHSFAGQTLTGLKDSSGAEAADGRQTFSFETLPRCLVLQLKRFRFGRSGANKVSKYISYPARLTLPDELLAPSLRAAMAAGSAAAPEFRLCAVICHHGSTPGGGHYTAFVRDGGSGEWRHFDDHVVRAARPEDARSQASAYALLYRQD